MSARLWTVSAGGCALSLLGFITGNLWLGGFGGGACVAYLILIPLPSRDDSRPSDG